MTLTRTVRFSINEPGEEPDPVHNSFGGYPSMRGLGRYYEIDVSCAGAIDPVTGYSVSIRDIDDAVRRLAVPVIAEACRERPSSEPGVLLGRLIGFLDPVLGGRLRSMRLRMTPYYSVEMGSSEPHLVVLRQRFDFAAAHRLNVQSLSEAENRRIFGRCNNPNGHGHNYQIEPAVEVRLADGAQPFSLRDLEAIVSSALLARFDHTHLNLDTDEFAPEGGLNPSVENIARVFYEILAPEIRKACNLARLRALTVWETDKTSCTYPSEESPASDR